MKISPTLTLAAILATGLAGAAVAQSTSTTLQTTAPSGATGMQSTQAQPAWTQAPAGYGQPQTQAAPATQADTGQMPSSTVPSQGTALDAPATTSQTPPATSGLQSSGNAPAMTGQTPAATSSLQGSGNDQVRQAQEQLRATGLYTGPADGLMDPDTRAAIANFQQQNGLRRTNQLDSATLAKLNSGQTTGSGSSMPGAAGPAPSAGMTAEPMTSPATSGTTGGTRPGPAR